MIADMKKGVFVLSLDTELAWGCCFDKSKLKQNTPYFIKARENISALLNLLERYNISATWAVVGHLFLSSCQPVNGVKHPEIVRPKYSWFHGDWFDCDPCSSIESDPVWYGRDIVETIKNCKIPQEIGCHTFSHIIVDDPGCSQHCFNSELKLCRDLADGLGIDLKSFVFPKNKSKYLDSLAANSFIAYRGEKQYWYRKPPALLQYIAYAIDRFLLFTPPVSSPTKEACWNIEESYFWGHCDGAWKFLPITYRVKQAKMGIDKAARQAQVFHLWFHPFNLATAPNRLLKGLEEVFRYVNRIREESKIENLTMGALVEKLEQR